MDYKDIVAPVIYRDNDSVVFGLGVKDGYHKLVTNSLYGKFGGNMNTKRIKKMRIVAQRNMKKYIDKRQSQLHKILEQCKKTGFNCSVIYRGKNIQNISITS